MQEFYSPDGWLLWFVVWTFNEIIHAQEELQPASAMLYEALKEMLPLMVNKEVNKIAKTTVPIYVAIGLLLERQKIQDDVAAMISKAIQKDRDNLYAEVISQVNDAIANQIPPQVDSLLRDYMSNNTLHVHPTQTAKVNAQDLYVKRQKISKHGTYSLRESSSGQAMEQEPNLSGLGKQERKIDSANSKEESPVVHSCQRDPKAPPMTLLNQDKFYSKHGNSGPKKDILSLHKYPAVPFPDDDIKEQTSRWVSKRLRKFNVYARYGIEHWKNMWAKQDHIRRQKQLRDNPHEVYSESKIVEIIRTTYEFGHEHKFITRIIVRRANGKIDPITKPDYKYLSKNVIEDMYLLCINDRVKDYRETELLGSLVVFIRSTVIWERVHDFHLGMESY
ncbi:hypothetical protein Tco_1167928 [Tanacetum coccineum]